ncbi:MAG TPA: hypothetical protein DD490_08155 [Acidobacteria bacterium]|nr:hypothetical protein [Acidobacteriota bacterium]
MSILPESPRSNRLPVWLLPAALLAGLGYFATEAWLLSGDLGFPLDDSWIHLQFARQLAAGEGLAYNSGELVTGSTAPLWTALLALLFYLPGSVIVWTKVLGMALYLAGVAATFRLGSALGLGRGLASFAAALTLATSWLVWSSLSGMEVPLFVALSLAGISLHLRERAEPGRPPLAAGVFAVAALARPEGLLLLVLSLVDHALVFRREEDGALALSRPPLHRVLTGGLLAVCALVGPVVFYRLAGGSFLPTTFAAKGGELRRFLPDLQYLYTVLGVLLREQPYMVLLAGAGILALVERLGTPRDRGLLPALWLVALPLAYSTISPAGRGQLLGNFGRYYFPFFPVLILLGVLGLERAAEAVGPRLRAGTLRLPLHAVAIALVLWPTLSALARGAGRYAQSVANVQDSDVAMARWLAPRLHPEAVLAVNDIGALKYLLPNRVIDLAGIANPEIRRAINQAMQEKRPWEPAVAAEIDRRRPDYLVVFPSWFPALARDARFRPLYGIEIRDNITMGGDEVVVYATPWTRYPLKE